MKIRTKCSTVFLLAVIALATTSCGAKETQAPKASAKPAENVQPAPQKESENTEGLLTYQDFKQRFKIGALQLRVPFTLADSLIQEGSRAATMQTFFTDNTDLNLLMTPESHVIKELGVHVSGQKTDGVFNDIGYAIAVIWALEDFEDTQKAATFLQSIYDLPAGEKYVSESGFRYSHSQNTESTIGFTAVNTKVE